MDTLPSNNIFDIFSRVPAKCLARSRCVSKEWCKYIDDHYLVIIHDQQIKEEPSPILYHTHLSRSGIPQSLCFHVIESIHAGTTDHVFKPKKGPFLEFLISKDPLSKSSYVELQGSCNGLICLSQEERTLQASTYVVTSLVVVHPLRKERYELPPLSMRFHNIKFRDSCGFGFDASTNTLKMVCVLCKSNMESNNPDELRKHLCTMVHVFGTNSWREIPKVPSYPTTGKSIFANGCLHWLVSYNIKTEDGVRHVIRFDVEKEEFGVIDPPKRMCDIKTEDSCYYDHLVDLNGEVGYVSRTLEVWVLKQKEWAPHCRFEKQIVPDGDMEVLGCWNKDGDMLIRERGDGKYKFFVHNIKSGVLHQTSIVCPDNGWFPNIFMLPN